MKIRFSKILHVLGVAAAMLLLLVPSPSPAARSKSPKSSPAKEAALKKARHYYLAGAIADAQAKEAEAYELFKKAHKLAPDYPEAAYSFGVTRLANRLDTMSSETEVKKSIELVRSFVDSHQEDIQENLYYAYLANFSDPNEAVRIYRRVFDLDPSRTSVLLQMTEALIRTRKFADALESLKRYESIEGENPAISTRKVQLMVQEKDTAGARRETDRLVAKYPADIQYRMLRGSLGAALGDSLLWESDLLESQRIEPDNAQVKLALADLALSRGDSVAYDNMVYEALLSSTLELPDKIDLLSQYLQQLIDDQGERARGDNLFKALEKQYPHQAELLELESRYRMANGDYAKGIDLLEYALSLDPDNEKYWRQLMGYGLVSKRYEVTRRAYDSAKTHLLPDYDMKMIYALASSLGKEYEDALGIYEEVAQGILGFKDLTVRLDSLNPMPRISVDQASQLQSIYNASSDIFFKTKRFPEAYAACENSLFLSPGDPLVLNNFAYFLAEGDHELPKALSMSREAIDADPENPTYLDTFAWILFKSGDAAEALEYQRKAIDFAEKDSLVSGEIYDHLAQILKANGLIREAREAAAKAEELKKSEEQ